MAMTHTYTKTYALMDSWAQTFPWDCLVPGRTTTCCSELHDHDPMVGDPCAAPGCGELLGERESCHAVTQLPPVVGMPPGGRAGHVRQRLQWVCWRHVHPDKGPRLYPKATE